MRYPSLAAAVLLLPMLMTVAAAAAETEADSPEKVLPVLADGSGDYATIQAAIDAARPGDVVRIGPGIFRESLTISKPVTIEGAGWDKTRIVSAPDEDLELTPEILAALGRIAQQLDAETQAKLREAMVRVYGAKPTVRVRSSERVVLRGLAFLRSEEVRKGGFTGDAAVDIEGSSIVVEDCAILESPGTGMAARGESHVTVRNCLVTNAWGKGIAVSVAEAGSFEIADSEIRNNRYSGVSISSSSPDIRIQRCRIHGAGWHGVRYDSSRPLIEENVFRSAAVSGIYASGKTAAVVRNNLFHHSGISCWFQNGDTIEANTFVGDRHAEVKSGITQGLQVLGASHPTIRHNIFVACENGVYVGEIGGDRPHSKSSGAVDLAGNVFWNNERNLARSVPDTGGYSDVPLPEGNREQQPAFVDAASGNFRLQGDSPLAEAGVGAQNFAAAESAWPPQPEEARTITEIDKRFGR
ncbi:MAG: nitrous oxide reductase family maturation protein NosD [Maioricimonas sp. JB049]